MNVVFPKKIELAQLPTPIQNLSSLSKLFGGPDLYMKRDDLTGMALSGNKIRKLEFIAGQALQEKYQVLITCGGIQSNHARATAAVAAMLGLKAHLVLRGAACAHPNGNLLLDLLLGAQVTYLPNADHDELNQGMLDLASEYSRQGLKALVIPLGASNATGAWGYIAAVQEILSQMRTPADAIVAATGSAGTLAGLIIGKKLFNLTSRIIGISVGGDAEHFSGEIVKILAEFHRLYHIEIHVDQHDFQIIDDYVGAGYAKSRPEELRVIAQAAQSEGILLDPVYTGKALYGLRQEIEKGAFAKDQKILFIHTGGVFGLFPEAPALSELLCE